MIVKKPQQRINSFVVIYVYGLPEFTDGNDYLDDY